MKCEEIEGLIIDYLENKLEPGQIAGIEKHLETCEKCLDDFKDIQEVLKLMSLEEMKKPDDSLRINFYHMLHNEIRRSREQKAEQSVHAGGYRPLKRVYRIAAGILIIICSAFAGMIFNSQINASRQNQELSQLKSEINELRKTALISMLRDQSSSYRIEAVNYAEELEKPDENVIRALVSTLNNDKNVNVRLAAAYALAKYPAVQSVRDSLVKSLPKQSDPILQVTLINILVEMREKNALKPIEQIITDKKTLNEVRSVAERGAQLLEI
jgi:HEAT repeat protein